MKRLFLALALLASAWAHAAVDLAAKPASGTYTFNTSWTGANGATEPDVYYHIDEGSGTTLDDLGSGAYDGTITGADWVTDGSAAALDFVSANSDYVTNLAAWGIANTSSDWTAALIVSIDSGAANDTYFSLGDTTLSATHGSQVFMTGGIGSSLHNVTSRYHGGTAQNDTGAAFVETTWQLMWFQWTASTRTLKVYTDNGTEDTGIALVVTSGQQVPDSTDGRIGAGANSTINNPADARIAGFMAWKTTALTSAQMQDVCNWNGTQCEPWPFLTPTSSCPATCAGGRSARCITDTSNNTDPNNILYGQSPAVTANEDTVCYDATSALGDTVNVTNTGYPSFASAGKTATDSFDYCIMDNGAACGTDGKYEVSFQPVIESVTGIATGQTTADITVTPSGPTEGAVQSVAISKTSYDTYGAPTHAQIRAGVDANNSNVAWGSEFTKSFLSTVSPGWTFSRASIQTYTNSSGNLATVTSGNPAFNYLSGVAQGVLLEGSRTNQLPYYSEDANSFGKFQAVITQNSVSAPDGATTADTLQDDNSGGTGVVVLYGGGIAAVAGNNTYSAYFKKGGLSWVGLGHYDFDDSGTSYIDIDTCTTGYKAANHSASGAVSVGNGWCRAWITFSTTTDLNGAVRIYLAPGNSSVTVPLDGTSSVYVWGQMVEAGAFPSSYIKTSGSTVTRQPTSLTRSWNFPSNDFSGQIKLRPMFNGGAAGTEMIFSFGQDITNAIRFFITGTYVAVQKLDVTHGNQSATVNKVVTAGELLNLRFSITAAGGVQLWVNELAKSASTNAASKGGFTATVPSTIKAGMNSSASASQTSVIVESLTIWNEAKSDAFLEALQ